MISLNVINGAQSIINYYIMQMVANYQENIIAVEMGIGYGGGLEMLGYLIKGRGKAYGYDTFEDLHPDFLSKEKYSFEARCMDNWYNPALFGTEALNYDYMRKQLDTEHLTNVYLIKGLVNKDSCKDLPYINYVLLDMDIMESMKVGFEATKDKIVKGGLLFLHDAVPDFHLPRIHKWYKEEVLTDKGFRLIGEWPTQFLVLLEKL